MKKALSLIALFCTSLALPSCSSNPGTSTSTSTSKPSGLAVRAFISNPLAPSGAGTFVPVLNIVDAKLDRLSFSQISLTSPSPGLMALSPSKRYLLIFASSDNSITVVDTTTEALATTSSGNAPSVKLPDVTPSMIVGADNATGYAAVPAASVAGSSPGAVVVFNLTAGSVTSTIPVPGARFVAISPNGNRVLAVDGTNCVTVITPSNIGTSQDPGTSVCGFDHPTWAVFADSSTAYVLNCGPECGGTAASVSQVDLNTNSATATVPLTGGATVGLLSGSTLYVAGSPPGTSCGSGTAAPTCGTLETVNVSSMTVTSTNPAIITDGTHNRMEMGANGQVFVGAVACSNVNNSSEVRGCLSIFDTVKGGVVVPPDVGDVTGIQPITDRNMVYVCQNGNFRIYDTTTDKIAVIAPGPTPIAFVGRAVDVKLVD